MRRLFGVEPKRLHHKSGYLDSTSMVRSGYMLLEDDHAWFESLRLVDVLQGEREPDVRIPVYLVGA
jgi:hypothetical protein